MAPKTALKKKTFDGEKRSTIHNTANNNVPAIKPNCTADVSRLRALSFKENVATKLFITPLLANHNDVQKN